MTKENEIVLFETEDREVKLSVPIQDETVWLTQDQMSALFDTARSSIAYHIGNIFKEKELKKETSVEIFDRSKNASRPPQYYNLDVIISVGYRVKSQRGIEFRRWANKVLKGQYTGLLTMIAGQWSIAWKTVSSLLFLELKRSRAKSKEYWRLYIRMYSEERFILLWKKKQPIFCIL